MYSDHRQALILGNGARSSRGSVSTTGAGERSISDDSVADNAPHGLNIGGWWSWLSLWRVSHHAAGMPASAGAGAGAGETAAPGSTGSGPTSTTPTPAPAASSPFTINLVWDASVANAPAGFTAAVTAAAQYLESQFTNPITVTINVGYGEVAGQAISAGALSESRWYLNQVSYASLLTALQTHATDATDAAVLASLPATSPVNGQVWVTSAQAKALGLGSGMAVDGYVGFSSTASFTYDDTGGVPADTYDFSGCALHEFTEVLGRTLLTGSTTGGVANSYALLDLLHYSAPGVHDVSASTPGYFSTDGGVTGAGDFNTDPSGDAGDWSSTVGNDACSAFTYPGVATAFTTRDLTVMDAIGWNLASGTPVAPPSGVSVAPASASLSTLGATEGLAADAAIANLAQIDGQSGDSFAYSLGGAGAESFALGADGTLCAGASGVAGGANGAAYALTVTATDTTLGLSSSATPIEVVVGGSHRDTVPVAALVGPSATAAPTFVFGLGGGDTLNGTGMSGPLYFVGGALGDTMTGGAGVNDFLYGATSDSTPWAMDVITNFHASRDLIDLTGIGSTPLNWLGQINATANTLPSDSIAFNVVGGNTFLYVNTSGGREYLGGADMKIALAGNVPLTEVNVLHH
jgi:hypothetical protein